jgi:DNA-binding NtrC family response regulator
MKAKMLLADDDEEVLAALSAALASEDYDVVVAKNGREAIEHFEEDRFDIALLDLNMPVKGGWEAFERLTMIHPLLQVDSFGCRQYRQSDFAAMRFAPSPLTWERQKVGGQAALRFWLLRWWLRPEFRITTAE